MKDEDWHVREAAVRALGPIAPLLSEAERAPLIEPLIKAMKDEYSDVRQDAVRALGQIGPQLSGAERAELIETLITAMKDRSSDVRRDAAEALGPIAPLLSDEERAPLIEPLIKAMKDEYSYVRRGAAEALGQIAPLLSEAERAPLIEPLIKAMKDEDWEVHRAAADALGQIAPRLSDEDRAQLIETLIKAMKDRGSHVRKVAAQVLVKTLSPDSFEIFLTQQFKKVPLTEPAKADKPSLHQATNRNRLLSHKATEDTSEQNTPHQNIQNLLDIAQITETIELNEVSISFSSLNEAKTFAGALKEMGIKEQDTEHSPKAIVTVEAEENPDNNSTETQYMIGLTLDEYSGLLNTLNQDAAESSGSRAVYS